MKSFTPVLTLFVLPAILVALLPGTHDALSYNRDAIRQGELWRLWSGHWVHFSVSHLAWNLVAVIPAGVMLEELHPGWLLRYAAIAAPLISVALLLGEPAMHIFGGLSGLVTGVVTGLALLQLRRGGPDWPWWAGLLGLTAARLVYGTTSTGALFSRFDGPDIRACGPAHAAGAAIALALFLSRSGGQYRSLPPASRPVSSVPSTP